MNQYNEFNEFDEYNDYKDYKDYPDKHSETDGVYGSIQDSDVDSLDSDHYDDNSDHEEYAMIPKISKTNKDKIPKLEDIETTAARKTFEKILISEYDKNTVRELNNELQYLLFFNSENKFIMTTKQFNSLMKYMTKKNNENCCYLDYLLKNKCFDCLKLLAHKMTRHHLDQIIGVIDENKLIKEISCEWLNILIDNKFNFSNEQVDYIKQMDLSKEQMRYMEEYTESVEENNESKESKEDHIHEISEQEKEQINKNHFIAVKKLVHHSAHYHEIMNYIKKNSVELTYDILSQLPHYMLSSQYYFLAIFHSNKIKPDMRSLQLIYEKQLTPYGTIVFTDKAYDNYFNNFFDDCIIQFDRKNREEFRKLDFIFNNTKVLKNTLFLISKCYEKKIVFNIEYLKKLICCTYLTTTKTYDKGQQITQVHYKFTDNVIDDPYEEYFQIISFWLDDPKIYSHDFIEYVIKEGDELTFDTIIDKVPVEIIDNKLVLICCKNGEIRMLEKLLSINPSLASNECINIMNPKKNENNVKITNILLKHGLKIDIKLIELMLQKDIVHQHLSDHNIPYDMTLYKLCHKHAYFPKSYIENMYLTVPNLDIRNKIRDDKINDDNIINIFVTSNIIPDDMMYDDAVRLGRIKLSEFFEKQYGFKPNFKSCMKINDYKKRMNYYSRCKLAV